MNAAEIAKVLRLMAREATADDLKKLTVAEAVSKILDRTADRLDPPLGTENGRGR